MTTRTSCRQPAFRWLRIVIGRAGWLGMDAVDCGCVGHRLARFLDGTTEPRGWGNFFLPFFSFSSLQGIATQLATVAMNGDGMNRWMDAHGVLDTTPSQRPQASMSLPTHSGLAALSFTSTWYLVEEADRCASYHPAPDTFPSLFGVIVCCYMPEWVLHILRCSSWAFR